MSYKLMLERPVTDDVVVDETPSWLANSYKTIPNHDTSAFEVIDRNYEKEFGVKLIYSNKIEDDHTIIGVAFPSKDDATMFLLRWS